MELYKFVLMKLLVVQNENNNNNNKIHTRVKEEKEKIELFTMNLLCSEFRFNQTNNHCYSYKVFSL